MYMTHVSPRHLAPCRCCAQKREEARRLKIEEAAKKKEEAARKASEAAKKKEEAAQKKKAAEAAKKGFHSMNQMQSTQAAFRVRTVLRLSRRYLLCSAALSSSSCSVLGCIALACTSAADHVRC